jgi:hypothetical protein
MLPALTALIKTGVPTYLVIRSPKQEGVAELIPGLAGSIKEPDFLKLELSKNDRFVNFRSHSIQTEHTFGSDEFFQSIGYLNMVDVCELIARDFLTSDLAIDGDFRKYEPFSFTRNPETSGRIILVPGSAGSYKCWPASNWVALYKALKDKDMPCVMLGQPHKSVEVQELLDLGMPWVSTPTFADAVNAVSSAKAMVSVDTGLLHLAVQQGIPSIGMYLKRSIFYRPEENCFPIFAPECGKKCLGWTELPPSPDVYFPAYDEPTFVSCSEPPTFSCIGQISVDVVLNRLLVDALKN